MGIFEEKFPGAPAAPAGKSTEIEAHLPVQRKGAPVPGTL